MKLNTNEVYILDNIITRFDCIQLYETLINSHILTLKRVYTDNVISYPHISIDYKNIPFVFEKIAIANLLRGLVYTFNSHCLREHNFNLPISNITKATVNVQKIGDPSSIHTDGENSQWTLLFFITPDWKAEYGGNLQVANKEIEYKTGRALLFNSNIPHDAKEILKENNFYRVSIALHINL